MLQAGIYRRRGGYPRNYIEGLATYHAYTTHKGQNRTHTWGVPLTPLGSPGAAGRSAAPPRARGGASCLAPSLLFAGFALRHGSSGQIPACKQGKGRNGQRSVGWPRPSPTAGLPRKGSFGMNRPRSGTREGRSSDANPRAGARLMKRRGSLGASRGSSPQQITGGCWATEVQRAPAQPKGRGSPQRMGRAE